MTKIITEKLSVLMDNELDDHDVSEIIDRCKENKESFNYWENCHLISAVLKNNLPDFIRPDFSSRVSLAIQNESGYQQLPPSNVVPFFTRNKGLSRFAIAASVSAIAVVVLMQVNQLTGTESFQMATQSEEPLKAVVAEKTPQDEQVQDNVYVTFQQSSKQGNDFPVKDPELQQYLVNYDEFMLAAPVQVPLLPYTKIVNHDK